MKKVTEKELSCVIYGKVQGVGYRMFIKQQADILGVFGYVMNNNDGSVEIVAQGSAETLEELLKHIKRGPFFARVDEVEIEWSDQLQDSLVDFLIE